MTEDAMPHGQQIYAVPGRKILRVPLFGCIIPNHLSARYGAAPFFVLVQVNGKNQKTYFKE